MHFLLPVKSTCLSILSSLNLPPEYYLAACRNHGASHYSVFSSLLLTPRSTVLPQSVKKFPALYGHRMFITIFTEARPSSESLYKVS
jgi:hypothetical protein